MSPRLFTCYLCVAQCLILFGCDNNTPTPNNTTDLARDASTDLQDQPIDLPQDQSTDLSNDMASDLPIDLDQTRDLNTDTSSDLPTDESWEVIFQQTHPTVELTKSYSFDIAFSGLGEPANPNSIWRLTSKTAPNHTCDTLLSQKTGTSVQLTIPANTDPRCADELTLSVTVNGDAMAQTDIAVTMPMDVVTQWTADANNPQPAISTCPAWDCLNHSDPTPGRLPNGDLAIWFAAGGDVSPGKPVIGRAIYNGMAWSLDTQPVMVPTDATNTAWDTARETPSIRWNAQTQTWDMWYLGYNTSYFDDPAIGQARSMDDQGTQWTRPSAPIYRPSQGNWDESFLTSPGAVLGSDGVWRLYYTGASFAQNNGLMQIGVLTSTDGQNWTPHTQNPIFRGAQGQWDESLLDPHVQFIGGKYVMFYSALQGQLGPDTPVSVGVATSEDGYTWTRHTNNPILSPTPNSWMDFRVLDVEVLIEPNGDLLMVGYATSKTPPDPNFPDFKPGRIGLWRSSL